MAAEPDQFGATLQSTIHLFALLQRRITGRIETIMDRRDFLQKLAIAAASIEVLPSGVSDAQNPPTKPTPLSVSEPVDLSGFQLTAAFTTKTASWKVYEDWNSRE